MRVSFTDPCVGHRFAGIIYPVAGGWIWEVLGEDKAGLEKEERLAKKKVEIEVTEGEEGEKVG